MSGWTRVPPLRARSSSQYAKRRGTYVIAILNMPGFASSEGPPMPTVINWQNMVGIKKLTRILPILIIGDLNGGDGWIDGYIIATWQESIGGG
jgi:hypothetical protein